MDDNALHRMAQRRGLVLTDRGPDAGYLVAGDGRQVVIGDRDGVYRAMLRWQQPQHRVVEVHRWLVPDDTEGGAA